MRRDGARPSIEGGPLPVERDEPLRREIADFVRAVRTKIRAAGRRRRRPARAGAGDADRGEDGERRSVPAQRVERVEPSLNVST